MKGLEKKVSTKIENVCKQYYCCHHWYNCKKTLHKGIFSDVDMDRKKATSGRTKMREVKAPLISHVSEKAVESGLIGLRKIN